MKRCVETIAVITGREDVGRNQRDSTANGGIFSFWMFLKVKLLGFADRCDLG